MKKYFLSMMSVMMMALVCVGFSACGDDDNDGGGSGSDSGLVGVWKRVYKKTTSYQKNNDGQWVRVGEPEEKTYEWKDGFQFFANGKFVELDFNEDGSYEADDDELKYKVENGNLYYVELDHDKGWELWGAIVISGNQFELTEEETEITIYEKDIYDDVGSAHGCGAERRTDSLR